MWRIVDFPSEYALTNELVEAIYGYSALSKEEETDDISWQIDYRNIDFFVRLKDSHTYSFTAFTPEFVIDYIERENERSFVAPGLILVRDVNRECLIGA